MKVSHRVLFIFSILFSVSCGKNIFTSFSDETSDEALLFAAKDALDKKDYAGALTIVARMTAEGQVERQARVVKASAHGGLCAVEFLPFLEDVANGTSTLMITLMTTMAGSSATAQGHCTSGIEELRAISAAATSRTNDENMLMTVLSMGRIGSILNQTADPDDNGLVDNTPAFDYCDDVGDTNLAQIIASFAETIQSLSAVGNSSVAQSDMADLTSACGSLPADANFCAITDEDVVTAEQRRGMKGVIGSNQSIGLNLCNDTVPNCAAACP